MSKDMVKGLIDLIDERDMDTIFKVLAKFVPEESPCPTKQPP